MQNGIWKEYVTWDATIKDYFGNIIMEHVWSDTTVWAVSKEQAAYKFAKLYKDTHPMCAFAKIDTKYIEEMA